MVGEASQSRVVGDGAIREEKKWIMKAVKNTSGSGIQGWAQDAWTAFVDLLKVRLQNAAMDRPT